MSYCKPTGPDTYELSIPYSEESLELTRKLPGRRYEGNGLNTFVVKSPKHAVLAADILAELEVQIPQELIDHVQHAAEGIRNRLHLAKGVSATVKQCGLRLFSFQEDGVAWLLLRDSALLLDEMGLGKTIEALMAIPEGNATMVVCPASLKLNWQNEARRWRPDLMPVVLDGRGSFRLPRPAELVIVNYELLPALRNESGPGLPFVDYPVTLVIDECHYCKNWQAKRAKRVSRLCSKVRTAGGTTWGLTGTPLLNRPPELWSLLCVFGLVKESFGNYEEFKRLFRGHKGKYGMEWRGPTARTAEVIHQHMETVSLRRERKTVLPDLPTKIRKFQTVAIDAKFKRQIDKWCEKNGVDADEIRRSLETCPEFERFAWLRATLAKAKIPRLLELVNEYEAAEEPLVVFCAHRAPVEALGERDGWEMVLGGISHKKREETIERFQAGKLKGIAVTIRAGGLGITLTRAAHAVFVDMDWTPGANQQAEDRLCRIGSRGANYTYLVADHPMDEAVCDTLAKKEDLVELVVVETSDKKEYAAKAIAAAEEKASRLDEVATAIEATTERQRAEEEKRIRAREGVRCPGCKTFVAYRRAGRNAQNPGRWYASCKPCDWFEWRDE